MQKNTSESSSVIDIVPKDPNVRFRQKMRN